MKLPIIFINYGNPWYLKYAITQAIGCNPNSKVILIGDKSNIGYKGVEHYMAEDYIEQADKFSSLYEHMNSNPYKYELFCFQRWFILYDFIVKNNINEFFILDSDVLLYDEVVKYAVKLGNKKSNIFISKDGFSASVVSSFILSREFLHSFLKFTINVYKNKTSHEYIELLEHYNKLKNLEKKGGICDMNLWYQFSLIHSDEIYDGNAPLPDNCYFDSNTASKENSNFTFDFENDLKKIIWKKNQPYIKAIKPQEELFRAISLHFQGDSKKHMPKLITYKGFYYLYNCYWIGLKNRFKIIFSPAEKLSLPESRKH